MTINDLTFTHEGSETGPSLVDINLDIERGEFVSIIGANGAGKTSLCNAIRGFIPHLFKGELTGEVRIDGQPVTEESFPELARQVGFVFQNPFTQMTGTTTTVYDELAYGLGNLGVPRDEMRRRVDAMVDMAHLEPLVERHPFQLSGGQQQRVALASILVMGQPILVIDEPTSQLDPKSTDDIFELIENMKDRGITIVLVEHKMEHVARYSDRVILMDDARIVAEGTPAEVFNDPRTEALGTRLPQPLFVARALRERGLPVTGRELTLEELVEHLRAGAINGKEGR
ncbi:energy-coupling factor ABC transporter ATP-binding protein [Tessaracoccus oleiagri]|uniref:energy-coupling factor ABC transporter ATP-binding protein n=1 Tax=Tessaracoccus oleiagri TaxID=686624 RepID=UPI0015A1A022|nr:ABC transporter ATP-binding protein [Tessaracoccus oleiagri]